jgi:hypothetical protein
VAWTAQVCGSVRSNQEAQTAAVCSCFIPVRVYIDTLASANVAYWKLQRAPALDLGGMDGTGVQLQAATSSVDVLQPLLGL